MVGTFCEYHRRTPCTDCGNDILADEAVSTLVSDQPVIEFMKMVSGIRIGYVGLVERCGAHQHIVREGTSLRLLFGVNPVSYRPALHENNRMVAVLAAHGGRETSNILGLGPSGNLLETGGCYMMALIHNKMPIVANQIIHHTFAHKTLNDSHIQSTCGLSPSSSDLTDNFDRKVKEG